LVDYAVATGTSYINLKGINRPDKSTKIDRFAEIFDYIVSKKFNGENANAEQ